MEPSPDVAHLQMHLMDRIQWRDELIRPVVVLHHRTAEQRAQDTHPHPDTLRKLTRRFRQQGILGLLPEGTTLI